MNRWEAELALLKKETPFFPIQISDGCFQKQDFHQIVFSFYILVGVPIRDMVAFMILAKAFMAYVLKANMSINILGMVVDPTSNDTSANVSSVYFQLNCKNPLVN